MDLGPSWPTGRPDATAHTVDTSLTANVRMLNTRLTCTPLRNAMTSGTPDAAAAGSM